MVVSLLIDTTGRLFTFTVTVSELEHPATLVPVTMYDVVVLGDAKGSAIIVSLRPVDGVHK